MNGRTDEPTSWRIEERDFVSSALRFAGSSLPLLLSLLLATSARAQVPVLPPPDTTALRALVPDTVAAPPDTLGAPRPEAAAVAARPALPPPGFAPPAPGRPVSRELPITQPATGGTDLLRAVPGGFVYNLGAFGWPDGWSPYGLPPHQVTLRLDGRSFDDLLTDRPRYDLLPVEFLQPLRIGPDRLGTAEAVYATLRPYDTARPLTELRYRAGDTGLQSIAAVHTQRRRLSLLPVPQMRQAGSEPGRLDLTGGYFGRAADNEYPGSDLRRERRLLARARYARPTWSVELTELHTRHSVGAQGGVVLPPEGTPFEAIFFDRADANVRHSDARRRTVRNDLALTLRTWLLPALGAPLTASASWTAQFFRYTRSDSAYAANAGRYGLRVRQRAALGRHRLLLRLDASLTRVTGGNALAPGASRTRLTTGVRDSLRLGGLVFVLEGALHTGTEQTIPSALVALDAPLGPARGFAEVALAGQPLSLTALYGYEPFLRPVDSLRPGRVLRARAGLSVNAGLFDAALFGFAHQISRPLDYYALGPTADTVRAAVAPGTFRRAGFSVAMGFRRAARRGIYAAAQATVNVETASHPRPRAAEALPALFGQGRLGARFALFTEDLIIDAYVRGRFWSEMRSRTLHAPTGLLVLPTPDGPLVGPGGTVDLMAEARIRTATLFFAYENALSGTRLKAGALLVPTYPLPARRFRFGVYWPIFN